MPKWTSLMNPTGPPGRNTTSLDSCGSVYPTGLLNPQSGECLPKCVYVKCAGVCHAVEGRGLRGLTKVGQHSRETKLAYLAWASPHARIAPLVATPRDLCLVWQWNRMFRTAESEPWHSSKAWCVRDILEAVLFTWSCFVQWSKQHLRMLGLELLN